ncbi:4Fe-4S ferredoxin [Gordonibacter sp. 28C]|uniref:4Fe-4S dicluster domain-containing protein n=1 Tax=Gordonibacter sp. 28C TaxID=2078569 RepID=UPI000DF761E1|nr:4Fe-4S dicluster domain-containing protein [Gordonibacter sp. 28C]RDB62767.1 4Fe-4S ferredoxin [Gordonibacter sp. 28C]
MPNIRYGIVIDTKRCVGCHTCAVACKCENNLSKGIWWNRVVTDGGTDMDTPSGQFPNNHKKYYTISCQHCENPACVKVCPVGATYKDPETGVVRQDYDKCIGCRMCMAACPYTGVRSFNWEEPKYSVEFSVGDADVPPHQKHVVEKCTMCWHKLAKGEEPECISACPAFARTWGDLNDPASDVSKLLATRSHEQLLPDRGTNPSVYYLL